MMNNMKRPAQSAPVLIRISIPQLTVIVSILPAFATLFCVVWSVLYNFRESTHTHCQVYNFLPSVSAAISSFAPQKYVWRICIALHVFPRILLAIGYYHFHTSRNVGQYNELFKAVAAFNSLLNITEVSALVVLSYISSTENYEIHEMMFIVFISTGLVYMLLTCLLLSYSKTSRGRQLTPQEKKSLNLKVYIFIFKISIFLLSVYFFYRHNRHCEPGVYSIFAALEYIIIFANISFHATIYYDVPTHCLTICEEYFVSDSSKLI